MHACVWVRDGAVAGALSCHVGSRAKWKDKTLWVGTFPAISADPTGQPVSLFTGDESEVMEPVQSQL